MHIYLQGEDATTLSLIQRPWFRNARHFAAMDRSRSNTANPRSVGSTSDSTSSPTTGARSRPGARARNSFSYQPPHKRAPTDKVVAALQSGDVNAHAKNFARHLSRGAEDQSQLSLLLDALDVLGSREKPTYCHLVQRLAEEVLFECIEFLCTTITGVGRVHLDVKVYNVIRLMWVTCLYPPALHHLSGFFRDLLIPYHGILLACCRTLRRSLSTCSDSSTTTSGTYSRDLSSDCDALVSKESVTGVAICTLSVMYNSLLMAHNHRELMEFCCQSGVLGIIVSLLRRTRSIMVGETCLRILDLACEHGGTTARTILRDHQVMREAANLWHFMLRRDLVTKSGFHIAELIARLSEYLRHGSKGYAGSSGFASAAPSHGAHAKTDKTHFLYRPSQVKMVLWCSAPSCSSPQETAGQKLKLCARCRLVMYCSQDCQSSHWTNGHRERCVSRHRKSDSEQGETS